jgi:hypothetical protein
MMETIHVNFQHGELRFTYGRITDRMNHAHTEQNEGSTGVYILVYYLHVYMLSPHFELSGCMI